MDPSHKKGNNCWGRYSDCQVKESVSKPERVCLLYRTLNRFNSLSLVNEYLAINCGVYLCIAKLCKCYL